MRVFLFDSYGTPRSCKYARCAFSSRIQGRWGALSDYLYGWIGRHSRGLKCLDDSAPRHATDVGLQECCGH